MPPQTKKWLDAFMSTEMLPTSFRDIAADYYVPLAEQVNRWVESSAKPLILGINGGQGTGKSTLSEFLGQYLKQVYGLATCIISIDDLYLNKDQRNELASNVHPLLTTRGVPGTHDVSHGTQLITQLQAGELPKIPRFNKATDQPFPEATWCAPEVSPNLIILEGWCVGARSQPEDELELPINSLEEHEDADGEWRRYVNAQLAENYAPLFCLIDHLVMLKTPSFELIHQWRSEQEAKLAAKLALNDKETTGIMSPDQITRFISHYERLTRWMLKDIPSRADYSFQLNAEHQVDSVSINKDSYCH